MRQHARKLAVLAKWYEYVQFDEDGLAYPESPDYYEDDRFDGYDEDDVQDPTLPIHRPTETTPLLIPPWLPPTPMLNSLYCSWSRFYIVSQNETVLEPDPNPSLSMPSSPPPSIRKPSALSTPEHSSGKRRAPERRSLRYTRPKSVRFSGVHKVMFYDKLDGEPIGCHQVSTICVDLPAVVLTFSMISARSIPSPTVANPERCHFCSP